MIAQCADNQINNQPGFRLESSSLFAELWACPIHRPTPQAHIGHLKLALIVTQPPPQGRCNLQAQSGRANTYGNVSTITQW